MPSYKNTVALFLADYPRTLFPLETNRILVENAAAAIGDFIYQRITPGKSEFSFLPQRRAYGAKPGYHLRRTVKLDPIAEFFLYDIIYRHRNALCDRSTKTRQVFGYHFSKGQVPSLTTSYHLFRRTSRELEKEFEYTLKFDITAYLNSIYHHDLVGWFRALANTDDDSRLFDKYFKQINSGRSIDCLPHGILPAKIVGSNFLHFLDESYRLKTERILRFMDDLVFFSDSLDVLIGDFQQAQRLLGEKGLSVNASKTRLGKVKEVDVAKEIDDVKLALLKRRTWLVTGYEDSFVDDEEPEEGLNEEELEYLLNLLKNEHLTEEDAELVLTLMREHAENVLEHVPTLLRRFPNLSKNVCYFCEFIDDKETLATHTFEFLLKAPNIPEYQLFWLGCLAEKQFAKTSRYPDVLMTLYDHKNATSVSKAKILEIPEKRFGMPDLREEHLKTGASDWLGWASAVGTRSEKKATRNHLLDYFSNASPLNKLIADCVKKL